MDDVLEFGNNDPSGLLENSFPVPGWIKCSKSFGYSVVFTHPNIMHDGQLRFEAVQSLSNRLYCAHVYYSTIERNESTNKFMSIPALKQALVVQLALTGRS